MVLKWFYNVHLLLWRSAAEHILMDFHYWDKVILCPSSSSSSLIPFRSRLPLLFIVLCPSIQLGSLGSAASYPAEREARSKTHVSVRFLPENVYGGSNVASSYALQIIKLGQKDKITGTLKLLEHYYLLCKSRKIMQKKHKKKEKKNIQKHRCSIVSVLTQLQVAQLSQRDRAAGWVSCGQKWKTGTGRLYFTDIIGLSSTM